jgi:hypothetical protein
MAWCLSICEPPRAIGAKFGDEMDLACAEFVAEDLWLQSLKVTSTSNADSDSEPLETELESVSPASLPDLQ